MLELTIKLYSFHELNQEAQRKAIEEHRQFLIETEIPGDCETWEEYNEQIAYLNTNDDYIIENIEINEYTFFADGKLCWSCTYTGGPKKGLTEIKIHGELFTLGGGATK